MIKKKKKKNRKNSNKATGKRAQQAKDNRLEVKTLKRLKLLRQEAI